MGRAPLVDQILNWALLPRFTRDVRCGGVSRPPRVETGTRNALYRERYPEHDPTLRAETDAF